MKRLFTIFSTSLLICAIFSCNQKELEVASDYGYLTVGISEDLKDIIQMKSDDRAYEVRFFDSNENLDTVVADHRTITEENPVKLLMDKYTVVASYGEFGVKAAFNAPYYSGEGSVRIYPEKSSTVSIKTTMSKVKISASFPEDSEFTDKFTYYALELSNGDTLTISSSPDLLDPSQGALEDTAYFEVPESGEITYVLRMRNYDGAMFSAPGKLEQVQGAEHYHFRFTMGEEEAIDGALVMDVSLNGEYLTYLTHRINLNFDKTYLPVWSTNAEFGLTPEKIEAGDEFVYPLGNSIEKKITFDVPRKIKNLIVTHMDPNLLVEGVPQLMDYVGITSDDLAIMNDAGIKTEIKADSTQAVIDITELVKKLPISPDNQPYILTFAVLDKYDRSSECKFTFTVVSDINAETGNVFRWSSFAIFNGKFFSRTAPEGISFQYKKSSDSEWTEIDPDLMEVDLSTLSYSYRINGLEKGTTYEFRATSTKDKEAGKTAATKTFTTYETENTVHNLSFDEWYKDGKAWYPNKDAVNFVWDSANGGTADIMGMSLVPTTPEETIVIKDKAVKMKSDELLGNFAAGNVYTGKFGKATISPLGATLQWGVQFNSRPLALRGWYRYEPQTINRASASYEHMKGQTDYCQIQIFLTDWTAPFDINTGKNQFVDTSEKNPSIIAYGGLVSQENTNNINGNTNGYIQFTIPLEYRNLNNPSYIVISGAASRYGDYFTGAIGSTMYLDELELVYDPDELTDEEFEAVFGRVM